MLRKLLKISNVDLELREQLLIRYVNYDDYEQKQSSSALPFDVRRGLTTILASNKYGIIH
jgi:hypothetical protein